MKRTMSNTTAKRKRYLLKKSRNKLKLKKDIDSQVKTTVEEDAVIRIAIFRERGG